MFCKANCARSREFPPAQFSNCKEKLGITKKEENIQYNKNPLSFVRSQLFRSITQLKFTKLGIPRKP